MEVYRPNFEKRGGLVVVVTQVISTREIIMVTYANEAAYLETLETGEAVYFSTKRNNRWKKGEEDGRVLIVRDILIDCDGDALVYLVDSPGEDKGICHTGAPCCFFRRATGLLGKTPVLGANERLNPIEVSIHGNLGGMKEGTDE